MSSPSSVCHWNIAKDVLATKQVNTQVTGKGKAKIVDFDEDVDTTIAKYNSNGSLQSSLELNEAKKPIKS